MKQHQGEIIERAVRRSEISITELARRINTNRRSLYNWFQKPTLETSIIERIGKAIDHDFSSDFPNPPGIEKIKLNHKQSAEQVECVLYWKERYLNLLETYNNQLQNWSYKYRRDIR
jgi:hypothetical protein